VREDLNDTWIREALERYEGRLCRYAARLLGDEDRARDAVQETFLRLCRQSRVEVEGHLAEWLFAVCRTRALDRLRKEGRMSPITEQQEAVLPSRHPDPVAEASRTEMRQTLEAALAALPPGQQEAIRLKFQEGLSYREISRVTGTPEGTVGSLIHNGMKALRMRMGAA